jgi:hypothetical protein
LEEQLKRDQKEVAPDLHLFKCLELIHLGYLDEAQISLDEYKGKSKEAARHPLHLLALARLSKLYQPDKEKLFLSEFAEKFPAAVDYWMNNTEKSILTGEWATYNHFID